MRFYRVAWVVTVLSYLTAVGSILASIFGADLILLAILSPIVAVLVNVVAHKSQVGWYRARAAELERRQQQKQLEEYKQEQREREEKEKLERQKRSLDPDWRKLLQRAETAVSLILSSVACQKDLMQPSVDKQLLLDNKQAIFDAGREITDLKNKHNSIIVASSSEQTDRGEALAGPLTSAVINPQRNYLALALESAKSRVENLERYASAVREVDKTYKDWIGAKNAEQLNERIIEVVAKTAADELAAKELHGLAEATIVAEQAFRHSVEEANLAAETLALPPTRNV